MLSSFKNENLIKFIILFLGITIPFLFNKYVYNIHDGLFHLRRFEDVYLSLKNNYFTSFVSQDLLNGMGYPTLGFYPYLFIIPFVLPMFLGFSAYFCYSLYHIAISALTIFTSYIFIKELTDNKNHHYIFILSVLISPMRIYDTYLSASLGRYSAYAILPLVFLGIYRIFKNKKGGLYILSLSMTLMAYTHILSTVIMSMFIFIICIFNFKTIIKNTKIIFKIILAGIISILSSSFVIFPIIEQLQLELICNMTITFKNPYLLSSKFFGIWLFLIFLILSIFIYKKEKTTKRKLELILVWLFIMQTNIFPWEYLGVLKYLQFTFRILLFLQIFLGLYIIIKSKNLQKTKKILEICTIFLIVMCVFQVATYKYRSLDAQNIDYKTDYYEQNVGFFDYLPYSYIKNTKTETFADLYDSFNPKEIIELNKNSNIKYISSNSYEILNNNSDFILIPKFYYYGYQVKINNKICKISQGDKGLIKIHTNNINKGRIDINYIGTPIQHITKYISFVFLLLYCIYPIYIKKQKKCY
jgi:hypothetical protein